MGRKYSFTGETKTVPYNGAEVTLHQIVAVSDFGEVHAGDVGGWIESEDNLSQEGEAWVSGNGTVYGNARIYDAAVVKDNASVYDCAKVYDTAEINDSAQVSGKAEVSGSAIVGGGAHVLENSFVCDISWVCGKAIVTGNAEIMGESHILESAIVGGGALLRDSTATDHTVITGRVNVIEALVYGNAVLRGPDSEDDDRMDIIGPITFGGYACIESDDDWIQIEPAKGRLITLYRDKEYGADVSEGCSGCNFDEFLSRGFSKDLVIAFKFMISYLKDHWNYVLPNDRPLYSLKWED